ncbi:ABC transporter ATP-binding protein [Shinella pollutisoli]|uniref:ABC transporter ATP-binding protein n=1 Tax=Shinella pollutisoli TaxID=2250594 RepID=A0ABV7DLU6_9HYPH|nr:ABC transporter ATP-binding protein [Shinella pollutisoli]
MTHRIEINAVSKSFGAVQAVRDVSFSLAEGEIVALVGHNGAGKTTLIKLMLGLIRPTSGTVRVLGGDPAADPTVRARLGYLPENVSFNPALTGRETLSFYAALKRAPSRQVAELLDRVGLSAAADRRVRTYSKGMRQRLGLAQALIGAPQVLLLDEPTTGLDPALRRDFYGFLDELRAGGATILLSSHALSELEGRADHIVIMGQGVKIADGTLDALRGIARLPTRIRVRLAEGEKRRLDGGAGWRPVNGHMLEIDAAPEEKVALLRAAVGAEIADLDVTPPTLDELYAHFQDRQREAGR